MWLKVNVKVVPDHRPNDDGEWQEIRVTAWLLDVCKSGVFTLLSTYVKPGYHVVSYKVEGPERTRL
jgi:hypothetical protein